MVRIPGWVRNQVLPSDLYSYSDQEQPAYSVTLNGKQIQADPEARKGYLPITGIRKGDVVRIHFDMPVRTVVANRNVGEDKGRVAVERGPLVYCAESADNQGELMLRTALAKKPSFSLVDDYTIENTEAEGAPAFSVKAITTQAQVLCDDENGMLLKSHKLTLIPYYVWNHRGAGQMNVWFLQSVSAFGI